MNRPYWSLRNKTEDIERALARGDSASARLAAHELGVRLSHTVTAAREHTESTSAEGQASSGEQPIERALSRFGAELDRLIALLKAKQASRAVEVVQLMFLRLDDLDRVAMTTSPRGC